MEIKNIYEGWRNLLREKIFENVDDPIAAKKIEICSNCKLLTKMLTCNPNISEKIKHEFYYGKQLRKQGETYHGCGCFIPAKARSKSKCPLGKWEDI